MWSDGLSMACYDHIKLQGPAGEFGHIGVDGSTFEERASKYAESYMMASETMVYLDKWGHDTVLEIMKALVIDDGVEELRHRKLFFDPEITHIGVSCGCHSGTDLVCCIGMGVDFVTKDSLDTLLSANRDVEQCTSSTFGANTHGLYDDAKFFDEDDDQDSGWSGDDTPNDRPLVLLDARPAVYSKIKRYETFPGTAAIVNHPFKIYKSAIEEKDSFELGLTYEDRSRKVLDELNDIRDNPSGYAEDHYDVNSKQYQILTAHKPVDSLDWDDTLTKVCLAYVNEYGSCGGTADGRTIHGNNVVDYFEVFVDTWGHTTFGLLYGDYYLQSAQKIVDNIVLEIGDSYLFNGGNKQFGIGCS